MHKDILSILADDAQQENICVDPIYLSKMLQYREQFQKSSPLSKKATSPMMKTTLGAIYQYVLELIYKQNPLLYLALGHHKNTRGKRIRFTDRFLLQIYHDDSRHRIFRKCVQVGISEMFVITSIGAAIKGETILYVMPTIQLSNTFVSERFDALLRTIPYYTNLLTDGVDNKTLKQFGDSGSIYFTGAGSSKGNESQFFSSVAADWLILDEYDKISMLIGEHKIGSAYSRLKSAEGGGHIIECANPRASGVMIDGKYRDSCQWTWMVPCNHCGKWQDLQWSGVMRRLNDYEYVPHDTTWSIGSSRDMHYYCAYCHSPMDRFHEKSQWVAKYPTNQRSGYHISRLMSHLGNISDMVAEFTAAIGNTTLMQVFYGDTLGLGYLAENAKIDDTHLLQSVSPGYYMPPHCREMTIAGVDVHKIFLHIVIARVVGDQLVPVFIGKLIEEDDIETLFRRYAVGVAAFDAMPETRMIKRLKSSSALKHVIYAVTFSEQRQDLDFKTHDIKVSRTEMLDSVQSRIVSRGFGFPENIREICHGEYLSQMTSNVRVSDTDDKGRQIERWVCRPGLEDHFFLATGYMTVAHTILKKTFNRSQLEDITPEGHEHLPQASIPLFGIQSAEDVRHLLLNNMVITVPTKDDYLRVTRPALLDASTDVLLEEHTQKRAVYWLRHHDNRFAISENINS